MHSKGVCELCAVLALRKGGSPPFTPWSQRVLFPWPWGLEMVVPPRSLPCLSQDSLCHSPLRPCG